MRPTCARKRGGSKAKSRRSATSANKKKRAKSKPKPKPKPKPKRKAAKRPKRTAARKKRSAAAAKGWETRRKRKKLAEKIQDLREARDAQPLGWIVRREDIREINGQIWREIAVEYSDRRYEQQRLAALEDLQMDLLSRDDLDENLRWLADEFDYDLSDMYRMYLGYPVDE